MENKKEKKITTAWLVRVALLGAVASVLMFLEISLPFVPPFLKLDFSDIPAFLAGFALGPLAGVMVLLIKNVVHGFTASWSFFVGELANFLIGLSFVLPASLIYARNKNRKSALVGMVVGGLVMTVFAALANYFALIPLYATVLGIPVEVIVGMSKEMNPAIVDLKTLVLIGIMPFNLFKAFVNTLIVMLIYKRLSPILHYQKRV
ncbi:MAG: ECF transporter S component [Clostridia bacterium]